MTSLPEKAAIVNDFLPPEILAFAFTLGYQSFPPHSTDASLFSRTVSAVCSWWQSIAHSAPLLWTSITLDHQATRSLEILRLRLEAYLSRSRDASLDFLLVCENAGDLEGRYLALRLMRSHLPRRRSSRVHVGLFAVNGGLRLARTLLPLPGKMGRLQELRLCLWVVRQSRDPELETLILVEPSNGSPLTTLHLLGHVAFDLSSLSSNTIRDLVIDATVNPLHQMNVIMQSTSSIKSLTLKPFSISIPTIHLPKLTYMATWPSGAQTLSRTFSCPHLNEFALCSSVAGFRNTAAGSIPSRLTTMTYKGLSVLTLGAPLESSEDFRIIFKALPTITTVIFTQHFWHLFGMLGILTEDVGLLPRFALLQLTHSSGTKATLEQSYIDQLKRFFNVRPLVQIQFADFPREPNHPRDAEAVAAFLMQYSERALEVRRLAKDLRYVWRTDV